MNRFKRLTIIAVCLIVVFSVVLITITSSKKDIYEASTAITNIEEIETMATETEPPTEPETEPPTEPEIEPTTETTEPEPIPEPIPEPTEAPIDEYTLELLACVIYQEAGGDAVCDDCRYRVADVVLNRVEDPRFPDTIYDVLTAPRQYGSFHWTGVVWPERSVYDCEKHAVERAYNVAADILAGNHSELYEQGYIWQAEFVQGTDTIYCCGHYFGR